MGDGVWNVTMQWLADDVVCKFFKFMQMFRYEKQNETGSNLEQINTNNW